MLLMFQLKLEYPGPLSVTMVAVGADFALVLGSCGIVWSWGNNKSVDKLAIQTFFNCSVDCVQLFMIILSTNIRVISFYPPAMGS